MLGVDDEHGLHKNDLRCIVNVVLGTLSSIPGVRRGLLVYYLPLASIDIYAKLDWAVIIA